MGNQICCEETRTQKPVLEDVRPEHHRSKITVKEPEPYYPTPPQEEPYQKEESIETPTITKQAQNTWNTQRFLANEFAYESAHHKKRYGDDVYVGELDDKKHKPHGLGKMYKPNGGIYLGYFDHGKAQGKGVFIFPDGSYYNGEFARNEAETKNGIYESETLRYRGSFSRNTFDGEAEESGQDYTFHGLYRYGVRVKGVLAWRKNNQEYRYEGPFNEKNQFHGKGTLKEPVGTYNGDFVNG